MSDIARTTRWREARSRRGVVAAPHALAAATGREVFRDGGNALDAAVAGVADLAVVYPHMNGVGGDSFWLIFDAERGEVRALNAAGRAAAGADLATYRRKFGARIPTRGGPAALTVPGTVSGWWEIHRYSQEYLGSRVSWRRLLAPAVAHARAGVPLSDGYRRNVRAASALFDDAAPEEVRTTLWPIYHPARLDTDGLVQSDLADSLDQIIEGGPGELYGGALGRRLAEAASASGSPLSVTDLAQHRADWVTPLRTRYREGVAVSFPPPTQGFAALAILGILEGFEITGLPEDAYVHLVVEATKLAFEDRDRYLADPDFVAVPVDRCLDPAHLAGRRAAIDAHHARPVTGEAARGDTIALVTADAHGNAVCVIQSLYHEFGSGVVAHGTGILLQNRGAFFSLDAHHPNCLAPGKRTAHTLIPSMYLVRERPRFVYGTMGGEGQPQTQAALVTRLVDRGYGLQAAVEAPRWLFGRTWGDDTRALRLEARFEPRVVEALRRRGHDVTVVEEWSDVMGHAQAVAFAHDLIGASDPRADGAALGA
jgi:gamma-glutamyltranspeptidase/glutathione hydrolase